LAQGEEKNDGHEEKEVQMAKEKKSFNKGER
jgi:hypothetical protein